MFTDWIKTAYNSVKDKVEAWVNICKDYWEHWDHKDQGLIKLAFGIVKYV